MEFDDRSYFKAYDHNYRVAYDEGWRSLVKGDRRGYFGA